MLRRLTMTTALLALVAVPTFAQAPSFASYVAIGDSLGAGYESASLVETHQRVSVPALLAHAGGAADFQMPLVSEPGIPPELALVSFVPSVVIAPKSATPGAPLNLGLARPYNNLSVPGHTSIDAATKKSGDVMSTLILRGLGTQVEQAIALHPTVITVWLGNNDVLGAAIAGRAIDGVTLTPTDTFRSVYAQIIAALKTTGATILVANLPDVTAIPYVTTIAPYVVDPTTRQPVELNGNRIPLLGPAGPLPPNAYVTLAASSLLARGIGIPAALGGTGQPLPDEVVLDPSEVAIIRDHVNVDNQSIAAACQVAGCTVIDIRQLFADTLEHGYEVGGIRLTSAFLTGGIFSYDGVHPTDVGYAIVANEFIKAMNAQGATLPLVDVSQSLGLASSGVVRTMSGGRRMEFSREAQEQLEAVFPRVDGR